MSPTAETIRPLRTSSARRALLEQLGRERAGRSSARAVGIGGIGMAGEQRRHQGAAGHRARPLLGLVDAGDGLRRAAGRPCRDRSAAAVSASRSSSKPSSRLADSTRSVPLSRSSEALKPSDAAASSWRWRKACASSVPAPSVSRRRHEVGDARLAVGIRWPCRRRTRRTAPRRASLLSSTSQALMPSGVVISLMSIAPAPAPAAGEHAGDSASEQRAAASSAALRRASAATSPRPSSRQTWRAAATTSAGVTAAMRCGQASMSAMVPPVLSAVP